MNKCYILVDSHGNLYTPFSSNRLDSHWQLYAVTYRKAQEEFGTGMVRLFPIGVDAKQLRVIEMKFSKFLALARAGKQIYPWKPGSRIVQEKEYIDLGGIPLVTITERIEGV